ncbi:MAG TPA: hypothetical protein VLY87_07600 [Flavobacterium sp.]|nr:hypothetical protein [Flavobacterium sp.]
MEQQNTPQAPLMSVKDWVITVLLTAIPLVGIILLFVWAFGNDGNQTRANWAKGNLIVAAIMIGLWMLIILPIFGFAFFSAFSQME